MKYLIILFTIAAFVGQESPAKEEGSKKDKHTSNLISGGMEMADCPNLITDHKGNSVLSWVEGENENAYLFYAVSNDNGTTFNEPIKVLSTKGLTPHHESMPKIAFKSDGTVVVVYRKKAPTPKNRFAGALYYTQTFNDATNWTIPKYLHSDTSNGIGRSFFDIATLPDGEIGAIWLDGRKRLKNGSTLFFAKTKDKKGFGMDMEIGQKTCQCCRTDIYVDENDNINVAYRDIINDSIRDMVHLISNDLGITFSSPKRISIDNWVISGCPHTGPTMTTNKHGLHFFWYTSGGGEGVYHTSLVNYGNKYSERNLINPHARHPQSTTMSNGTIAVVWDETFKTEATYLNRIGLLLQKPDGTMKTHYISSETADASYPVVLGLENGNLLVSWSQRDGDKSQVYYDVVSPASL